MVLLIREMRQARIVTVRLMHERACHEPQHLCADQLKIMRQNQLLFFGNRPPLNLSVTWVGELCVSCVTSAS